MIGVIIFLVQQWIVGEKMTVPDLGFREDALFPGHYD